MWLWLLISLGVVVADQLTKWLTVSFLEVGESVAVIPSVLNFTYVQNRGAAFGMLADRRWVFMIISTLAIGALIFYLWKFRPDSPWGCVALSLIIGGGIGNMIDRVALSYVIDFIDFCALGDLWVWVFNVADACVCVGGGILFVWCLVSIIRDARAPKAASESTEQQTDGESEGENS